MTKIIQYDTAIGFYCPRCDKKTGILFNGYGNLGFETVCPKCRSTLEVYKFGNLNPPIPSSKVKDFYKKEGWHR